MVALGNLQLLIMSFLVMGKVSNQIKSKEHKLSSPSLGIKGEKSKFNMLLEGKCNRSLSIKCV